LAETSTACPAGVVALCAAERAWLRAFCWRLWPPEREREELPDLAFEPPLAFERALLDLARLLLALAREPLPDFARELLDRELEPPGLELLDREPPDFRCPLRPSAMSALPR